MVLPSHRSNAGGGSLRRGPSKLQTRARNYLILFSFSVILALVAGWLWFAMRGEALALAEARDRALIVTRLAEENMRGTFKSVDLLLELADRALIETDLSQAGAEKAVSERLLTLRDRLPDLRNLWLADKSAQLVLGGPGKMAFSDINATGLFVSSRPRVPLYIGSLHGTTAEDRYFPIARPIERNGSVSGVLLAAFNPAWFQRFGRSLGLPETASVSILTSRGEFVTSTSSTLSPFDTGLWQKVAGLLSRKNEFGYRLLPHGEDSSILIGFQPLSDLNLVALYTVPYATIMRAWSNQLWFGSAIVGLAVLAIIGGTLVMLLYGRRQGDLHRVIGLRTAEAAQAAERLALAVDTTGIGIFDYSPGDRRIAWAGVEASYFGLRPTPELTPRALLRAVHPADRHNLIQRLRSIRNARDDTRFDTEFRLRHPEFGAIWVAARAKLFVRGTGDGTSRIGRLIGTLRDITERRLLQEHRETVLREINHRIKNSLQLMNSIMNLQSRRIASADERARFESARRRLISLATVYAHLDDTTRPDVVDLVPFLRRLCQDFSVAYMADGRVTLSFNAVGGAPIAATLAVPLGMAIGEILVNISLDAFPPPTSGAVSVDVRVERDAVEVDVRHNGIGRERSLEADGASLGRLLINAFVDQLGGTFVAESTGNGSRFVLRFVLPPMPATRPVLSAAATSGR